MAGERARRRDQRRDRNDEDDESGAPTGWRGVALPVTMKPCEPDTLRRACRQHPGGNERWAGECRDHEKSAGCLRQRSAPDGKGHDTQRSQRQYAGCPESAEHTAAAARQQEEDETQGSDEGQAAQVTQKLDEIGWGADEGNLTKERNEMEVEGKEEEPCAAERQQATSGQRGQAT